MRSLKKEIMWLVISLATLAFSTWLTAILIADGPALLAALSVLPLLLWALHTGDHAANICILIERKTGDTK